MEWSYGRLANPGGLDQRDATRLDSTGGNNTSGTTSDMCHLPPRHRYGSRRTCRRPHPPGQCAIQHVSHQGRPACPTCRQPWTREGGLAMEQARSMHQVPWMVPETPYDTRTHHVEAPPAPDHVIPLCCPRLVLIDHEHPEHDTSWRELPAPTHGMGTDLRPNHTAMATRVGLPPVQQHTHTRRPRHATHRTSTSLPHPWTTQIGHRFTAKRKGLGVQQGLPAPHPPMRAHANT